MPSVLFVCVANSFRSQMAEAVARSLGGHHWEIASAGSHPGGHVHLLAIQLMHEIGLNLAGHRSKGLEDLPAKRWDYVVTMGCGDSCPSVAAGQRLDWDLPDPSGLSLERSRAIRERIVELVRGLMARAAPPIPES